MLCIFLGNFAETFWNLLVFNMQFLYIFPTVVRKKLTPKLPKNIFWFRVNKLVNTFKLYIRPYAVHTLKADLRNSYLCK